MIVAGTHGDAGRVRWVPAKSDPVGRNRRDARTFESNPAMPFYLRGGKAEGGACTLVSADDGSFGCSLPAIVGNLSTPCGDRHSRSVVGRAAHPGSSHLPTYQSQMRCLHGPQAGRVIPQPFRHSIGHQFLEQPRYGCIERFHSHTSESGRVCQDIPARCQPRPLNWTRTYRKCPKSKGKCLGTIRKEIT